MPLAARPEGPPRRPDSTPDAEQLASVRRHYACWPRARPCWPSARESNWPPTEVSLGLRCDRLAAVPRSGERAPNPCSGPLAGANGATLSEAAGTQQSVADARCRRRQSGIASPRERDSDTVRRLLLPARLSAPRITGLPVVDDLLNTRPCDARVRSDLFVGVPVNDKVAHRPPTNCGDTNGQLP